MEKEEIKNRLWGYTSTLLLWLSLTLGGASFMMSIIGLTLALEALEAVK